MNVYFFRINAERFELWIGEHVLLGKVSEGMDETSAREMAKKILAERNIEADMDSIRLRLAAGFDNKDGPF